MITTRGQIREFKNLAKILCLPLCTQRWGHVGLPLSAQCVSSGFYRAKAAPANTRCWLNARLMLAHHLRCWAAISLVLGYRVVFGAMLNVGQRHRWQGNIDPAMCLCNMHKSNAGSLCLTLANIQKALGWCMQSYVHTLLPSWSTD